MNRCGRPRTSHRLLAEDCRWLQPPHSVVWQPPVGSSKEGWEKARKDAKVQAQEAAIDFLQTEAHSHLTVAEADVEALSTARAAAVQSALLSPGELTPDRVFLVRSDKVTAHEGKVRLELELK